MCLNVQSENFGISESGFDSMILEFSHKMGSEAVGVVMRDQGVLGNAGCEILGVGD